MPKKSAPKEVVPKEPPTEKVLTTYNEVPEKYNSVDTIVKFPETLNENVFLVGILYMRDPNDCGALDFVFSNGERSDDISKFRFVLTPV